MIPDDPDLEDLKTSVMAARMLIYGVPLILLLVVVLVAWWLG